MKKEIWIHIDSYRPNSNAPANRAFAFANYFSKKGYKVNIITIGKETKTESREEATVYYLKNSFHYKKRNSINRLVDNFIFSHKTSFFLKKHKADIKDTFFIVSVPEYIAGSSCTKVKKYGAKLITDVRDIWPEVAIEMGSFEAKSFKAKIFKHYAKKYYKHSDYIFTVSKRKVDHLKEITNHLIDNKIFWIGNGFDIDVLTMELDDSVLLENDLKNKKIVSYVGNVGKAQHLISLLKYANTIKNKSDLMFVIAGNGVELNNLQKFANDQFLTNVVFTGAVTKEQAKALIVSSFVSFVPLSSDKMLDSVPTKLFESLGLGTPVLLVAKGESADILNETGFGLCIEPSKINEIEHSFEMFNSRYLEIIKNKEGAQTLMKTTYSRQKYCKDFENIIINELNNNN